MSKYPQLDLEVCNHVRRYANRMIVGPVGEVPVRGMAADLIEAIMIDWPYVVSYETISKRLYGRKKHDDDPVTMQKRMKQIVADNIHLIRSVGIIVMHARGCGYTLAKYRK